MLTWLQISHRQFIGILLGLALISGATLMCSLVIFQSSESVRALQIQIFYCERQLSTVRAVALDTVLWVAVSDESERNRLSSDIRVAVNSIETVHDAELFGEFQDASLESNTRTYIVALRELVNHESSDVRRRELLSVILTAARGDLRIELEKIAEDLFKQRNLAQDRAYRVQLAVLVLVAVILVLGVAMTVWYMLRKRQQI
tara:strand:- start:436 stop:1041 length:606 start_codon:yes stop_codon:yes gene_type:complete